MKKLISLALVIIIALSSFAVCVSAADISGLEPYAYGVVNNTINVRSSASDEDNTNRIAGAYKGDIIFIIGELRLNGKNWYKINYRDQEAFVVSQFVTCYLNMGVGKVNVSALNVRSSPDDSTNTNRIGGATKDDKVFIVGDESNNSKKWYKIFYKGYLAYVLADKIDIIGQVNDMPAEASQEVGYKSNVKVNIVVENVPKGCYVHIGNQLIEQTSSCGDITKTYVLEKMKADDKIEVYITDSDYHVIPGTQKTLTVDVKDDITDKIAFIFKFLFHFFKYPEENIIFN